MCVCVCVFYTFDKTVPEKKKIRYPHESRFCVLFFCASFYISNKYIILSVKQVKSMQRDLTESRSLNWERIARHQKAVISFSYIPT